MKPVVLYRYLVDGALKWMPHNGAIFTAFVSQLKDGDVVEIRLKKQGRKKTSAQLGYYYSVIVPTTVNALRDAGHDSINTVKMFGLDVPIATEQDAVDAMLKAMFKASRLERGEVLKRNMTTEQMSYLIDFSLKWLIETMGVYCPPPER